MSKRLLIINADDLGYDPGVSSGILKAMRQGVVSSATLMVNTPYSEPAAQLASGLALGLHLNLCRFRPCSPSFPVSRLSPDGELQEHLVPSLPVALVLEEARSQLHAFERLCGHAPTHLDVHKHQHTHSNVLEALATLAAEQRLPVRALNPSMRGLLRSRGVVCSDHFIGEAEGPAYWTWDRFQAAIEQLHEGSTELMCHPGYEPSHVRSGYSIQRELELATFVNPEAHPLLRRHGVVLGTFGGLNG